jgi:hypothetical protein
MKTPPVPKIGKKRGRKPKGGKIISNTKLNVEPIPTLLPNVILHLKCNKSENDKNYDIFASDYNDTSVRPFGNAGVFNDTANTTDQNVWDKINTLKHNLHNNDMGGQRSACFYCTEPFDNPPIHLPSEEKNGIMEVYGCFCSPECAVGFLKNEKLDTSTLWERYALLNNIYSGIYKYKTNIKPAPSPYYTLDKYYGNLDITEYRELLGKEQLLVVVDKPLTKVYPDLFEDNADMPSIYGNLLNNAPTKSVLRLKRGCGGVSKSGKLKANFHFKSDLSP